MPLPAEWLQFVPRPRPLGPDEQWNVFLSYRSVNRSWVLNLYDVLREFGHSVFLDQVVLAAGDELIARLEQGLAASQAGVLVWSNATRDSEWVRREYQVLEQQATRKPGFRFIPVNLDGAELPPFASNRIFLNFSAYPNGPNGGELLRLLHAVVGESFSAEAAHFAHLQDEEARNASALIGTAIRNGRADRLIELFAEGGTPWVTSAALGVKAAEGLVKLDRPDDALVMLEQLERRFPSAIRPRQIHALALARRGGENDLERAQEIIGTLYETGARDPETLGIYGRTWMDRYSRSGNRMDLEQSRDLYAEAFAGAQDDYYTGINAAAKSVLLGDEENLTAAAEYARRVQLIVGDQPRPGDYWMTATVAEVFLIQRRYDDAARLYRAAVGMARGEVASHRSTWLQACRLMKHLSPPAEAREGIRSAFAHLPDCE